MRAQNVGISSLWKVGLGKELGAGGRIRGKGRIWGLQGMDLFQKSWIRRRLLELLVEGELERRLQMKTDHGEQKGGSLRQCGGRKGLSNLQTCAR